MKPTLLSGTAIGMVAIGMDVAIGIGGTVDGGIAQRSVPTARASLPQLRLDPNETGILLGANGLRLFNKTGCNAL